MRKNSPLAKVVASKKRAELAAEQKKNQALINKYELLMNERNKNKVIASASNSIYGSEISQALRLSPVLREFANWGEELNHNRRYILNSYVMGILIRRYQADSLIPLIMDNLMIGGLRNGFNFNIDAILESIEKIRYLYGDNYKEVKNMVLNLNNMFHYLSELYSNNYLLDREDIFRTKIKGILEDFISMRANYTGYNFKLEDKEVIMSDAGHYKYFSNRERDILKYFNHSVSGDFANRCIELSVNFVGYWKYSLEEYKNNKF